MVAEALSAAQLGACIVGTYSTIACCLTVHEDGETTILPSNHTNDNKTDGWVEISVAKLFSSPTKDSGH